MNIKTFFEAPQSKAAAVLGASLIVGVIIGGIFFASTRDSKNTLTTTGSAKISVVSDSGKFSGAVLDYSTADGLTSGYQRLASSTEKIKKYLLANGAKAEEITISPVTLNQQYTNNDYGPKQYELRQNVAVNSTSVEEITKLSNGIDSIVGQGVLFQSDGAQYFYSKLADLRVSLLGDALTDAKARAQEIAKASKGSVGRLKSATSGVVQVLAPNSIDTSDYGAYDTSTIEKNVSVTVRATFTIN